MEDKVVQIAIDSSETPASMGYVYGLTQEGDLVVWDFDLGKWNRAVNKK